MTFTIKALASYLGKPAPIMLADPPFVNWAVDRSMDGDLEEPLVDYVFPQNGMDLSCDGDERIRTIFLYADQLRCFDGSLIEISPSSTRLDILERFGPPSRNGVGFKDPILGEYGSWDRFTFADYTFHAEYRVGSNRIKMITLMRPDMVP